MNPFMQPHSTTTAFEDSYNPNPITAKIQFQSTSYDSMIHRDSPHQNLNTHHGSKNSHKTMPMKSTSSRPQLTNHMVSFTSHAYRDFAKTNAALILSVMVLLAYVSLGTFTYGTWKRKDGWGFVDGMYYTVVTFTTVGYGDFTPSKQSHKELWFTMFFTILGVVVLGGVALGILMDRFINAYHSMTETAKRDASNIFFKDLVMSKRNRMRGETKTKRNKRSKDGLDPNADTDSSFLRDLSMRDRFEDHGVVETTLQSDPEESNHQVGSNTQMIKSRHSSTCCATTVLIFKNITLLALIIIPALVIGHYEGWSIVQSLYYCIITATTIGYGDFYPTMMGTKLAAVFYLPLCVGIMANILSQISNAYMNAKIEASEREFLHRKLTRDDLTAMDLDQSDSVTFDEFLIFILIKIGKIVPEDVHKIRAVFDELDVVKDHVLNLSDILEEIDYDETFDESEDDVENQDVS